MTNKGKKLKRFNVFLKTPNNNKPLGQELAFSEGNAEKNVKLRFGKKAFVRRIKR